MTEAEEEKQAAIDRLVLDANLALSQLPIAERLQFVAELILVSGGIRGSLGTIPTLILAHETLTDVIKVLKKRHPKVSQLRGAEP